MTTRYWQGGAVAIPEVWTLSLAGTWATGDTAWVQINGKRLTLTVGSTTTVDQIGADIVDMINGAAANGTESRSALGSAVGEFADLTATFSTSTDDVTITGASTGRPVGTVTAGESTAGDGTLTVDGGAASTTGTGPYHYNAASNWSGNSVPIDGDDIVFDHQGSNGCMYGLDQSAITPLTVTVNKGFKYQIGLPEVNRDNASYPYAEHQDTYLKFARGTTVTIDGSNAQMIKIDATVGETAFTVTGSGTTTETGTPPVLLKGSHVANTLVVNSGSVGYCFEAATAGTLATINVGGGQSPSLEIGSSVTLTTISQSSGTITNRATATITTLTQTGGTFNHHGGTITTANLTGTLNQLGSGTITTAYLTVGGTIDCTKDARARTISNMHMYGGSIKDPLGTITFTNGIKLYAKPTEVTLDLPARKTYTLGAI